jgi:phosphoserine phosphatase RsbU/P
VNLDRGESLFLYTDGLSEMCNPAGAQFGDECLQRFLSQSPALSPNALVTACLCDLEKFASGTPASDDLTMMVIQRTTS